MAQNPWLPQSTFSSSRRTKLKLRVSIRSPIAQGKVIATSNEEMHVIRHDHISSYGHTKLFPSPTDMAFESTVGCA